MKDTAEGCRICGSSLTPHQEMTGRVCQRASCRLEAERRSQDAERSRAAAALGIAQPDDYAVFAVPHNTRPVTKLPTARRRTFMRYLKSLAAATVDPRRPEPAPDAARLQPDSPAPFVPLPASETALLAQACAACRGFCCHLGGDHAFLTAAGFRERLARAPGLTAEVLVAAYAARLPERSFQGACVFQGETGCTLPTDLRPAICNAYHCQGLRAYREHLEQYGPRKGCALVREDNRTQRVVLFDKESRHSCDAQPAGRSA